MSYFSQAGESSLREYQTKSVLILGVGGIAMSQVALLLKSQGFEVLGFDTVIYPPASDILCKAQIKILSDIGEITWQDIGFVVIGNSITRNHPTLPFVEALRIPYCCMPKIIKDFLLDKSQRIVVTGTHGKSTTSALIVHFLTELGLSPSFMVGAVSRSGSSMLQQGVSDIAVVEGDEYDSSFYAKISKFYYYNPSVIVVTALDYDHKDVFPTEESYIDNFRRFLLGLDNATFIIHQKPLLKLGISTTDLKGSVIIYPSSDFSFRVCKQDRDALKIKTQLELNIHQETYQLSTSLIGSHNFENILAASIATYVATGQICSSLENFEGLKRRLELRAKSSRFILIDDFAHHPSEVAAGLEALKSNYQGWNLCVFFEPRSNTSRSNVFEVEYAKAFHRADFVVMRFPVVRFNDDPQKMLNPEKVLKLANKPGRILTEVTDRTVSEVVGDLDRESRWILCVMSNGSFDNLVGILEALIQQQGY